MSDSICMACADLRQVVPLGGPDRMRKAHNVVMANLADNTICEVPSPTLPARRAMLRTLVGVDENPDPPQTEFATLMVNRPWPDLIQHYFRCTKCELLFRFFVDTYHGGGGKWEPVYDEDLA